MDRQSARALTCIIATVTSDEPEGLSTDAVAALAGVTFRVIDHWSRKGYLTALPRRESSGVKRRFSVFEAAVARQAVHLVDVGFVPREAVRIARGLISRRSRSQQIVLDEDIILIVKSVVDPDSLTT